jgi:hypothetical protein
MADLREHSKVLLRYSMKRQGRKQMLVSVIHIQRTPAMPLRASLGVLLRVTLP